MALCERFFDSPQFVDWMSSQTNLSDVHSTLLHDRSDHPPPCATFSSHADASWRSFGNSHANRLHTREFHDRRFRKITGACAILASKHGGNSNMDARHGDRATHFTRFARSHWNNLMHRPVTFESSCKATNKSNSRKSSE